MVGRGDRLVYERERETERDRFEDDRHYMEGAGGPRDRSLHDRRGERPPPPAVGDDMVRDRRFLDDDLRRESRRDHVLEKEHDREYYRDSSRGRPAFLRRPSSLDSIDRAPLHPFQQREEYPVPVRREDIRHDEYRLPPYTPIPLPQGRAGPPRRQEDRFYQDVHITERDRYEDHHHHPYTQEHIVEREIIREKERDTRDRSRESRSRSSHHRGRSRSSRKSRTSSRHRSSKTSTHRSSSSSSGSSSSRSRSRSKSKKRDASKKEYPRKGKTRIPSKLVSKRALIDLGYPFIEEGNIIIVQKALGQQNIDEVLKVSEEYKKSEMEVHAARSSAGNVVEERIEERREEFYIAAPTPPPAIVVPAAGPIIYETSPGRFVEVEKSVYREASPSRSSTSDGTYHRHYHEHGHHRHHHGHGHGLGHSHSHSRSGELEVVRRHQSTSRSKSRSKSRSGRELRAEIRALEKELAHRPRRAEVGEREIVRTERLPNGELVVYEEKTERVSGHKPARLEKDKKGRMYISMPKR